MSCSIRIYWDVIISTTEETKKAVEKLLYEKASSKNIFKIGMTKSTKARVRRGRSHMATRKELKVYAQLGHEYGADQPWDEMYCCNNRKLMIKRNKIAYFVVYPLNQLREVSNYGSL